MQSPRAVSLFSGAFGLDLGMEQAGFDVIWANELEPVFCETIRMNRSEMNLGQGSILNYDPTSVIKHLGINRGELDVLFGGPPCQSFSTAGRRKSLSDPRGNLIFTFLDWVDVLRPRFFLIENVRGLLSAALRHRSLAERSVNLPLAADEQRGSAMALIAETVKSLGYRMNFRLLNAADFGTPQARHRVIIIGSRDGEIVPFPIPTHSKNGNNGLLPHRTLRDAIGDLHEEHPKFLPYSDSRLKWLKFVPPGGNWRNIPEHLIPEAMGGAFGSGGGKVGFYRRLAWDKPSPTVTTSPHQKATDMCHPDFDRPISVREAARIQQFPDEWEFSGSVSQQYKQIGNAVPVGLATAVGGTLFNVVTDIATAPDIERGESQWLHQSPLTI